MKGYYRSEGTCNNRIGDLLDSMRSSCTSVDHTVHLVIPYFFGLVLPNEP